MKVALIAYITKKSQLHPQHVMMNVILNLSKNSIILSGVESHYPLDKH